MFIGVGIGVSIQTRPGADVAPFLPNVYYVSPTGNDGNAGTSMGAPLRTFYQAGQVRMAPGDWCIALDGTWTGGDAPNAVIFPGGLNEANPTRVYSQNPLGAVITHGNTKTFSVQGNYIEFEGFDLALTTGGGGFYVEDGFHHVTARGNRQVGGSQHFFASHKNDYITVEDNEISGIRFSDWWSAISIYQAFNVTGSSDTGFRNFICRNKIFDCYTVAGNLTDGNGIIVDDTRNTQGGGSNPNLGVNYQGKTLIEDNLVVGCGGKGIQVYESDNVTVRSNTAAFNGNPGQTHNGTDWWAEISASYASNCIYANNIVIFDPTLHGGKQRGYADTGRDGLNANTIWANNCGWAIDGGAWSTANDVWLNAAGIGPLIGANPLLGTNPQVVNPTSALNTADYRLRSTSPCINAGTAAYGVSTIDLLGNARVQGGTIDLGCYEGGVIQAVELWMSIPANVFTPPEMVVDGGFGGTGPTGNATSPSGSFQTGQYAIVSGQGRLTNGAAQQGFINIDVPAIAGRTYDASIDIVAGTSGALAGWFIQQADGTTVASGTGAGAKAAAAIVATGAAIRFTFTTGTATSGHTMLFDNMSLRLNQAAETALVFAHAVSLGAKGIRTDFDGQWVFFGSSSGRFWTDPDRVVDGAEAAGLEVAFADVSSAAWAAASPSAYPTTQLSAWATCMQAAAARYAGRVKYWEIRNEQNLAGFSATTAGGGSIASCAAAYMTYASAVATALRAGDPNAIIVSNGLSPSPDTVLGSHLNAVDYLTAMYANGASGVFDMIGFHPYSRPLQPENPASYNGWEIMETGIRGAMAAAGDGAKPIFATEFGFPTGGTSSGEQTSIADAATGITSAFALAEESNVVAIAYYSGIDRQGSLIPTPSDSNEDYYGAWTAALVEKAAITAALRVAAGLNVASDILFSMGTSGAATVATMPTHAAPSGNAKTLLLGWAMNANSTTRPTFDGTVGWTEVDLSALLNGVGTTTGSRMFVKYAASGAEAFGTHTNAVRCLCAAVRLSNPPANPLDALGAIDFTNKSSAGGANAGACNRWGGITPEGTSHILTLMLARLNQAHADRTGLNGGVSNGQTSGANRLRWGRSNGRVSSWAQEEVNVAAATETFSFTVEVLCDA